MKLRIISVLALLAVGSATGVAAAQVTEAPPPRTALQQQPLQQKQLPNGNGAAVVNGAVPNGGCANGGCANGNCGAAHGTCFQRILAWLSYRQLPAPPCNCQNN